MKTSNSHRPKQSEKGFSLVDVLVAITIVVLGISSLTTLNSFVIRNQRRSAERAEAIKLSQESMEWFKIMRQRLSWDAFYQVLADDTSPGVYCLPVLPQDMGEFVNLADRECVENVDVVLGSSFMREIHYTLNDPDTITVRSIVRWIDGEQELITESSSILKRWNEQ